MKQGCLFLLFVWVSLSAGYYYLLQGTDLSDQYWLPIVLALSVVIVIANIQGIFMALAQRRASQRSPHQVRDGELIGVSGTIQAAGQPIIAPFSGKESVIVEYEVKRTIGSGKNRRSETDFRGMLQVPCAIYSNRGPLKVVGFPLLAHVNEEPVLEPGAFQRAATYLANTQFKELSSNPLAILKELNEVLKDDDGTVKADFKSGSLDIPEEIPEAMAEGNLEVAIDDIELDEDERELEEISKQEQSGLKTAAERSMYAYLRDSYSQLYESVIPNGAIVTVFGTYRANASAIDIGSGLKHLTHQIHLKSMEKVLGAQLRNSIIALICWGAAALGGHYYVAKLIGYDLSFIDAAVKQLLGG